MSCKEAFTKELRERGLRFTPQREMVLSAMHELKDFASAEEVFARVQTISSAVDISTVYRTLELLEEFEVVEVVEGEEGRRYCLAGIEGPHVHLVCRQCGDVAAAGLDDIAPLLSLLNERYGFLPDLARLSIPGCCANCRATKP